MAEQVAQMIAQMQRQNEMLEQRLTQQATSQQQLEMRLAEQLASQQRVMQQTLEMQRAQTQAQLNALKDLGTAQVAKAATESKDHHSKAFAKMKVFKGDVDSWADWRYKFRVEASKSFKDAKAILDWAEEHYDHPILSPDVGPTASQRG